MNHHRRAPFSLAKEKEKKKNSRDQKRKKAI
jgi:hypothetical protein